jgi:Divergent InlB B-repeat domain
MLACFVALLVTPDALAGGIRMHVSGTGGGTIRLWPSGLQPCRAETPMLSGGCVYEDGGGGLIFQATADPGSQFDGWPNLQCSPYPGGMCQKSFSGAACCADIYVTFTKLRYSVTVSTTGTGKGSVVSTPGGIDCGSTCTTAYDWGTTITLTPQPATGSKFVAWTGSCSGSGGCTVTVAAAMNVGAVFDLDSFPVNVTKTGTGHGSVTSAPQGIACGDRCASNFLFGSPVTLTATAATGSVFAGWGGACSGGSTCTATIGATATAVTARFERVGVTTRLHGRTLVLALFVERESTLTVSVNGPSNYSLTLRLRPGRNNPSLPLPKRLRAGRYAVRFTLHDDAGSAKLAPATITLR